jgi:hypothetical protein
LAVFDFGQIFTFWALGSIIADILAIVSYIYNFSLDSAIYGIFYIFYSSKTVLGVILAATIGFLQLAVIFVPVIWAGAVYFLDHKLPKR